MGKKRLFEIVLRAAIPVPEGAPKGTKPTPARVVEMLEMGTEQLLRAFQLSGSQHTGEAAGWETKIVALRLCVVSDGGKPITYADLQGPRWDERFSLKETMILMALWTRVHEPSAEDVEGLGGAMRVKSGV